MQIHNREKVITTPSRIGANLLLAKAAEIYLDELIPLLDKSLHRNSSPAGVYVVSNRILATRSWKTSVGPLLLYPDQNGFYLSTCNAWVLVHLTTETIQETELLWAKESTLLSGFQIIEDGNDQQIDKKLLQETYDNIQLIFDNAAVVSDLDALEMKDETSAESEPTAEPTPEPTPEPIPESTPEPINHSNSNLWTQSEVTACVESYLRMLTMVEANQPINKASERRRLIAGPLCIRSDGSIEFRMQNISSVLAKYGIPWLPGYKPMDHVGPSQTNQIIAAIEHLAPGWIEQKRSLAVTKKIPPNIGFDRSERNAFFAPITRADDMLKVPEKSGINWGQRENRKNKNEAYILIPAECRELFPKNDGVIRLVRGTNGEMTTAKLTQEAKKALQSEPIDVLGKWLRDWIGVPSGSKVTSTHLGTKYTRVRIKRLSDDLFVIEI